MTLFTTLLVLIFERLFKLGEHWQLDHRLEAFFRRVKHFSLGRTLGMTIIAMGVTFLLLRALQGVLFNVPTLLVWLLMRRNALSPVLRRIKTKGGDGHDAG